MCVDDGGLMAGLDGERPHAATNPAWRWALARPVPRATSSPTSQPYLITLPACTFVPCLAAIMIPLLDLANHYENCTNYYEVPAGVERDGAADLPACRPARLAACLPACPPAWLDGCLPACTPACPPVPVCNDHCSAPHAGNASTCRAALTTPRATRRMTPRGPPTPWSATACACSGAPAATSSRARSCATGTATWRPIRWAHGEVTAGLAADGVQGAVVRRPHAADRQLHKPSFTGAPPSRTDSTWPPPSLPTSRWGPTLLPPPCPPAGLLPVQLQPAR